MSDPLHSPKDYYLGVEGEQSGPFSEHEIIRKLKSSEVPSDALVWTEGMDDWEPISSVSLFAKTISAVSPKEQSFHQPDEDDGRTQTAIPSSSPQTGRFKTLVADDTATAFVEVPKGNSAPELEPVFNHEADLVSDTPFARSRILFISIGLIFVLGLCAGGFYWYASIDSRGLPQTKPRIKKTSVRESQLSKALSEIVIDPAKSIETLKSLVRNSSTDKVGEEALQAVVDYYRRMQKPAEAGSFLLELKRFAQAAKFFTMESATMTEAANAYYQAYEVENGPERQQFLLEHIRILLHPLKDIEKATNRLLQFQKEFPGVAHPFGYYLRTTDERIADIFSRISFHFVQSLLAYISAELPQINLYERPLIEVKKARDGKYRIIGTYKGKVMFNRDTLSGIYFVFWLSQGSWHLVDTNLTNERKRFADREKVRWQQNQLNDREMLAYMEGIFREQFPKNALHEQVASSPKVPPPSQPKASRKAPRY